MRFSQQVNQIVTSDDGEQFASAFESHGRLLAHQKSLGIGAAQAD